jgi:hypothetical protein
MVAQDIPLDQVVRPEGLVTVSGIRLASGKAISTQEAVDRGWIVPASGKSPAGWGLERHEVSLGSNLFLDQGRQLIAYCFGFRAPISDFTCQKYSVGTGTTPPQVTDVALEAPITLASTGSTMASIDGVDFLSPFVVRVSYTIALGDANGFLIMERGLLSGNGTLFARHVTSAGINKTADFSPTLTWRIRF